MGNVLVNRPTLQPMKVLRQPAVAIWDERSSAIAAFVNGGPALDYSPLDPDPREHEVECGLVLWPLPGDLLARRPLDYFPRGAGRALPGDDLDSLTDTECTIPVTMELPSLLPSCLASADVDPLPLV